MDSIKINSEILFIYDAKLTNPNGDMDNENKPRMDYDTDTNLVSDVRLKRYIRDYFETNLEEPIFITEKANDAKDRGAQLKQEGKTHKDLIDCRMFGAVFAETGESTHLTGPIQFTWGYSLNPVELNESSTITSSFSSGEGVGKDYRVKYSLIAFSGGINAHIAVETGLTPRDVVLFDKAIINAIPANRTRSKMNQWPRFYLRVELVDNQVVLKDLREYIGLEYKTENQYAVRSIDDVSLDISKLYGYLRAREAVTAKIIYWKDDGMDIPVFPEFKAFFKSKMEELDLLTR
ncbi:MAG: type I-B CRISPR-associated protein Cas7/Csh2 [Candidatus Aminicenantes bacterium]|nr:type I-B CRISPR-associated protein Cas7/Csh2 [Candidatus Aminicenantes bacterium]NIM77361.1 type I-B CRISPR-associated protein Cas7/Csh2 [Candidatus Aminicenantes bacterium]NIN16659.1 type I-B CRISPR-associated protein Cas7/Csh2 [Candidatus Aminicenantes bacterium]NIN40517.1 type I-B CRISPR-associated protein Cas7/Csh2 [Candidatus Aminicenantes bacterium]NIN83337.1 type I-B CRISPR-associated protein Cas7/Csh2 [Candidatus Aminicenantes bacterium]